MYVGNTLVSSIEFHKNMSLVIFMAKCPLACRYCSNEELIESDNQMTFDEIRSIMDRDGDFMDALVVSGGEPLVQINDLIDIFNYARKKNLKTKLDTSGIYPDKIKKLLDLNLLDAVSLDIKAPFEKYEYITGSDIGGKVKESMELINNDSNVVLECRTTYVPALLDKNDIENIVSNIKADIYTIQQFRNRCVLDDSLGESEEPNPHELRELAKSVTQDFEGEVRVKSAEFGLEILEE